MISSEKEREVKQAAEGLFSQDASWATFCREILGPEGMVHKAFPTREEMDAFMQTGTYREILKMLADLQRRKPTGTAPEMEAEEPTRVITVRLPESLYEALQLEAYEHHTSMNKLCISKLLQFIDDEQIPTRVAKARRERRLRHTRVTQPAN